MYDTTPDTVDQLAVEKWTWGIDLTNALAGGAITAASQTASIYYTDTDTVASEATLAAPSLAGNIVSVQVSGLTRGRTYDLVVKVTKTASGDFDGARLKIKCGR